jgi:hypothetical protein
VVLEKELLAFKARTMRVTLRRDVRCSLQRQGKTMFQIIGKLRSWTRAEVAWAEGWHRGSGLATARDAFCREGERLCFKYPES